MNKPGFLNTFMTTYVVAEAFRQGCAEAASARVAALADETADIEEDTRRRIARIGRMQSLIDAWDRLDDIEAAERAWHEKAARLGGFRRRRNP